MVEKVNGRIKLSWMQIVWGISMLSGLGLSYTDIRVRLTEIHLAQTEIYRRIGKLESNVLQYQYSRGEIDLMRSQANDVHNSLDKRVDRLEIRLEVR